VTVRHEFEPDAGWRFYNDDVSLLLHASGRFRQDAIATNSELFKVFKRINKYLQDVGAYEGERQDISDLLTAERFSVPKAADFYKFLTERSLERGLLKYHGCLRRPVECKPIQRGQSVREATQCGHALG
jgi:hypothetical protein